jgi:hypothetical protein
MVSADFFADDGRHVERVLSAVEHIRQAWPRREANHD